MQTLDLVQGSSEWIEARLQCFCASEAPAMMGVSPYQSRTELMRAKKGIAEVISPKTQELFDKGHAAEEAARTVLAINMLEEFLPAVCVIEVDDLKLLASLDGISEDGKTLFEHKLFNKTLFENINNSILEPKYVYQLEQQLLVSGAEKVIFVCSDGTTENWAEMQYRSNPAARNAIKSGWQQFKKDLDVFVPEAKKEIVVAREQESFPLIECRVEGSMVVSNLGEYIPLIKTIADEQMSLILDSDQDFIDKEAFNKNVKEGRATLKQKAKDIENEFNSFAEFNGFVKEADSILQKLQSNGEKQVKEAKEAKKLSITNGAQSALLDYLSKLRDELNGVNVHVSVDFVAAIKGKRSIENMQDAVDSALANAKIEANEQAGIIRKNLASLTELALNHKFLFSDHAQLVLKDNDDLVNLIKMRIAEHEQAEEKRLSEQKLKIEREAKEKAERELEAKAEEAREKIRKEERQKAQEENAKKNPVKTIEPAATKTPPVIAESKASQAVAEAKEEANQLHVELEEWSKRRKVSKPAMAELREILTKFF